MEKSQKRGKKTSSFSVQKETENSSLLFEQINPLFNEDETNDFNLKPEKKAALSSMITNLKTIRKSLECTKPADSFVMRFDKLKMAISLSEHEDYLEFFMDIMQSNMRESDFPSKPPSKLKEDEKREEIAKQYKNRTVSEVKPNKELEDVFSEEAEKEDLKRQVSGNWEDDEEALDNFIEDENIISDEELEDIAEKSSYKYPDCKISYEAYKKNAGIINIYIQKDMLVIYLTGKFMASKGNLGYLTKNNIEQCLEKVQRVAGFKFNTGVFISYAKLYLCDVCVDIPFKNVERVIYALSSLFPLASNRHMIRKYGNHGLLLKSNAKNTGSCLIAYLKGWELSNSKNRGKRSSEYLKTIGKAEQERAKQLLRIEVHIYKLEDMRVLLCIQNRKYRTVYLQDVLESQATPILKRFEAFECTKEKLEEKIEGYIEDEQKPKTPIRTAKQLEKILACERLAELVRDNNFNFSQTKNHIITEHEIYDKALIAQLTTEIKQRYWDFLLYRKPKAIKIVIDLLNKIHTYYGRESEGANV